MSDEILLMMNQHAGWIAILLSAVVSTLLSVGIPTLWKMRNVSPDGKRE